MPTFFTTPQTPNGVILITADDFIFDISAPVFHDNGDGITVSNGSSAEANLYVNSTVFGSDGIVLDGADKVFVGLTGAVNGVYDGFSNRGVEIRGADNLLVNAGFITGEYGVFTEFSSSGNTIENSGTIVGQKFGISNEGEGGVVRNTGTISSEGIGVLLFRTDNLVVNSGVISGGGDGNGGVGAGVWFTSNSSSFALENTLVNTGTISAVFNPENGRKIAVLESVYTTAVSLISKAGNLEIVNSGFIDGDIVTTGGDDTLKNSGTVYGLVDMGNDADVVINSSLIDGSVVLGAGDDDFISAAAGKVTGEVNGDAGDDLLIGGDNADVIKGGTENDTLRGQGSDDVLEGGEGNDVLGGGSGDDVLDGGTEKDTIMGGAGDDTLEGGNGTDSLHGGAGDDSLMGSAKNDTLKGGAGDDFLDGGNDDDELYGQQGNDTLIGNSGVDTLNGGGGNDSLDGGGKKDILNGGGGNDTLSGGGSNDIFIFDRAAGNDVILGFQDNGDQIDLTAFGLQNFNRLNILDALNGEQGGTWIDLGALGGSGTIYLEGFDKANLDGADFIF